MATRTGRVSDRGPHLFSLSSAKGGRGSVANPVEPTRKSARPREIIGVSSLFNEERTDTNNPGSRTSDSGSGGDEAVEDAVGVRVEPRDLARVGDARDLGHFHAVIERLAGIIQERVLAGVGVVDEAVLAGGGVAVVAHSDAVVVDPEDLGEDERGARFPRDGRDRRVGDRGAGDGAVLAASSLAMKPWSWPSVPT